MKKQKLHFYLLQFLIFLSISKLLANEQIFIHVINLPNEKSVIVDSIIIHVNNALEGSHANTKIESYVFNIGNRLHYKTRIETVLKHLLFKPGDLVSKTTLVESERNLRDQIFFADAKIELDSISTQSVVTHITVFDQWSTVPLLGIRRVGSQWAHGFGVRESNLFGTGQTISIYHFKGITTAGNTLSYYNPTFTQNRLKLAFQFTENGEGYHLSSSLHRPLISKYDINSFYISYSISKSSRYYYYDGNLLDDDNHFSIGETNSLVEFSNIYNKYLYMDYTQSYGFNNKMDIRFFGKMQEITHDNNNLTHLIDVSDDYFPDDLTIPLRKDILFGIQCRLYQNEYSQTKNLNNFKWTENLNRIKLISFTVGKNIPQFGSENNNLFLEWDVNYSNFFMDKHFINANSNLHYYLTSSGKKKNGSFDANIRYQYRFTPLTNGKISTYWKNYIGRSSYEQLLLGESTGLYGYPNFYYSGDALLLIKSEVTMITDFEIMTVIPAITIFTTTGNTFTDYNHIYLDKLHSSIGIGLRFGLSRSSGAIVNHINFSWPLDNSMSGPFISIHSKNSL